MIINTLDLKNFRNYGGLSVSFSPGTNIFYGQNAQGKTNLLEAVYVCATTKSHRAGRERELIRFGEEEAHIKLTLSRKRAACRIDMHLKKNRSKGIAVNGVPIRKASELFGLVNVVFFSPEDLNLVKNGPAERRRFVDAELCQLNRSYLHALVSYNRVLLQRNRLLKDIAFRPDLADTLSVWDEQFVRYGRELIRLRADFIRELSGIVLIYHGRLSGGREELKLIYDPNTSADELESSLAGSREADLRQRTTLTGPHRDDIAFFINGIDLRRFGSQGQQRTAALSLKLAEIEIVKKITGEFPILLLDDVLSELDRERQTHLLETIEKVQTMITCTGLEDFIQNRFPIDRIFRVENGTAAEENAKKETT